MQTIEANYDFKKDLLPHYDEARPILNIFHSKQLEENVEDLPRVQEILQKVYGATTTSARDVMNSFWYTYKFALQIYDAAYFRPLGKLDNLDTPLEKRTTDFGEVSSIYPPFATGIVHSKYVDYYHTNFPHLTVAQGDSWYTFLANNYDHFQTHQVAAFDDFARLTHAIGNIVIVPENFHCKRSLLASGYWDCGMLALKDALNDTAWRSYIVENDLQDYVDDTLAVKPFWQGHFEQDRGVPQTQQQIETYLQLVTKAIARRSAVILHKWQQEKAL